MRIDTFKIEEWMNYYSPRAKYDLTSTCIKPMSLTELLTLCHLENPSEFLDINLTYGEIHGSLRLKNAIKSLYTNQAYENITVTLGAIGANQLVFESLLEKGDEVLTFLPTYQQHYSIPKAYGANVKEIFLNEKNDWLPNLVELRKNLTRRTKLICISNPNNPTGAVISDYMLHDIVEIAKENNSWILCDEAYRGLNHSNNNYSLSIADLYDKGISVGSMSKTYSLPGLRVGWVCATKELITEINKHREYNTISISPLNDYFAAIALENRNTILRRNMSIIQEGLQTLLDWEYGEIYVDMKKPKGGTTALIRYKKDILSKQLCDDFQKRTGVALLPGETMDVENTVRVGFCVDKKILEYGLKSFSEYLRTIK